MKTVDREEYESFKEAYRRTRLLIDDMERKKALRLGFRFNFIPNTEPFASILVHCITSRLKRIYDNKIEIILRHIRHRRERNNCSMLRASQNTESCFLLEYLQEINGRELSNFEHPEPDQKLSSFHSSTMEATEAEQIGTA